MESSGSRAVQVLKWIEGGSWCGDGAPIEDFTVDMESDEVKVRVRSGHPRARSIFREAPEGLVIIGRSPIG